MDTYIFFTPFSAAYNPDDGYLYCIQPENSEVEKITAHFFRNIVMHKADEFQNKEMTEGIMYYICLEDCAVLFRIIYTEGGFMLTGMHFNMKMLLLSWHNIKNLMIYLEANDDISSERRVNCEDIEERYDHYLSDSFRTTCRQMERQSYMSLIPRSFITGKFPPDFYGVSEKDILFVQAQYGTGAAEKAPPKSVRNSPVCIPFDDNIEKSDPLGFVLEYTDPPKKKFAFSVYNIRSSRHHKNCEFVRNIVLKKNGESKDPVHVEELTDMLSDENLRQSALFELEKIIENTQKDR